MGLRPSLGADISLLGAAAIRGATFVVVQRALVEASPFAFMAATFAVGAAALGAGLILSGMPVAELSPSKAERPAA